MNEYRVDLIDSCGWRNSDYIFAYSAQEAADCIRKDWPGCDIQCISIVVLDWQ